MATEVKMEVWCDRHLAKDQRVHAETFSIAIGAAPRDLDLCEPCHAKLVAPLQAALDEHGRPPEGAGRKKAALPKRTGSVQATKPPGSRVSRRKGPEPEAPWPCLFCERGFRSSSGLLEHGMRSHGAQVKSWAGLHGGTTCPECGVDQGQPIAHARQGHGWENIAQQFRSMYDRGEDPHGVIAAVREARGL